MTAEQILYELIEEFNIGDFVYAVKDREGNGWDGPRVNRFTSLLEQAEKLYENSRTNPA